MGPHHMQRSAQGTTSASSATGSSTSGLYASRIGAAAARSARRAAGHAPAAPSATARRVVLVAAQADGPRPPSPPGLAAPPTLARPGAPAPPARPAGANGATIPPPTPNGSNGAVPPLRGPPGQGLQPPAFPAAAPMPPSQPGQARPAMQPGIPPLQGPPGAAMPPRPLSTPPSSNGAAAAPPLARPGAPPPAPGLVGRPGMAPPPSMAPPPGAPGWPGAVPPPSSVRPNGSPSAGAAGAAPPPGLMAPPTGPPPTPGSSLLNRPVMRPPMPGGATAPPAPRTLQNPGTAGTAAAPPRPGAIPSPAPVPELRRPEPPPLRVLESLMPPPGTLPSRIQLEEVVEDEEAFVDDEDREFLAKKPASNAKGGPKRKQKVTAEMRRKAAAQRKEEREEKAAKTRTEREEIFEVGDCGMSLEELAEKVQVEPSDLVRLLFMKGIMLSMNQVLDKNTCKVVAQEYGLLVVEKEEEAVTEAAKKKTDFVTEEDIDDLMPRPPVVTVMGHVDHGKTSLLDYLRKARVAAGEAGGITQSIGAYNTTVEVDGELKTMCFLDTPGHEAFSAMRARGAKVTDVAIIIVAADDGVRPQTREAVSHAQAAGVPIVVAINKIDKPGADVERVKQELLELNLVAEEWGGNTPIVPVSAKKGQGMADLLQMVLWVAEEQRLMSNPSKPAQGTVIEAHLDKKVGPVATLLVQAGTLRVGDAVGVGGSCGKVRSMTNDLGQQIFEAGPSIALQLSGLDSVPDAGEEFCVYPTEAAAREAAAQFLAAQRQSRLNELSSGGSMVTLSSLASVDEDTEGLQRMNLVIKADTVGVVQAIKAALSSLPQESVALRYLLSGAGAITMSDVDLAAASQALLVGFNLEPSDAVLTHAKRLGVNIMTYKVIYEIVDDIKAAMEGRLRAVEERVPLGKVEVKAVFGSGKKRVAGCVVLQGKVQKGCSVTVTRGKKVVHEGKIASLRRLKDNVDEVGEGTECGLSCGEEFLEWQEGDVIEAYNLVSKSRRLEEAKATTAVDLSTIA